MVLRPRRPVADSQHKLFEGIGVPEAATFVPDEFQLQAIESLVQGKDTLVIAPTGAGKTYIAVEGMAAVVKQGKRAMYTAPLKALSNAKYAELKKRFEPEYSVGLLTGDRKIEGSASIVVATTEIYRNELYSLRETYGLVVLDEFHYLADPQRGPVWEESVILSASSSALLMLSASISNPQEIAAWIEDIRHREVTVIVVKERPVQMRLAFLHPRYGVIPLENPDGTVYPEVAHFYSNEGSGGRFGPFNRGGGRGGSRRGGGGGGSRRGRGRSGGGRGRS